LADIKNYFVFVLSPAAAAVASVLWLLLPTGNVTALMAEGGVIEVWTLYAYGLAALAVGLTLRVAVDKVAAGAILLVLGFLGAREMDLHLSLTGTSILRLSYYLQGPFSAEKAAALGTVMTFLVCVGYLWRRNAASFWRNVRSGEALALSAFAFFLTAIGAKILDRAVNVLRQDFGIDVPAATAALVLSLEETLELALPLIVVVAAVQYLRARRSASVAAPAMSVQLDFEHRAQEFAPLR
jgi:hypothetical protein